MKKLFIFSVLALLSFSATPPAQAMGWWDLWTGKDKDFRPYLENGTDPQNAQYRRETWTINDWAESPAQGRAQLDRFFAAGVFEKYEKPTYMNAPTVIVGPGFYHLSKFDQGRALALLDLVYGATKTKSGTIFIEDTSSDRTIGLYTRAGLQLQ